MRSFARAVVLLGLTSCGTFLGFGASDDDDPAPPPVGSADDGTVDDAPPPPVEPCPGVDLLRDPTNCGSCGIRCVANNEACLAGVCQRASCTTAATTPCDDGAGSFACVDTRTDPRNCGGCSNVCNTNHACVDGECEPLVFVTSTLYTSNLSGVLAADLRCQNRAEAGGHRGIFRAWISDQVSSPATRFSRFKRQHKLVDGTVVAAAYDDFKNGVLAHAIDLDETGAQRNEARVWTATKPDGTPAASKAPCNNWSGTPANGLTVTVGATAFTDLRWTQIPDQSCQGTARLYCVQQKPPAPTP